MTTFTDLTTIGIGGEIAELITCKTPEQLIVALEQIKARDDVKEAQIVAGGSNILPRDGDFDGVVIWVTSVKENGDNKIAYDENGFIWAGNLLDDVAKHDKLAPLSGIPGTFGGAIVQNAGAYGSEIADFLSEVLIYDTQTKRTEVFEKEKCGFVYRDSIFKHQEIDNQGLPKYVVLGGKVNTQEDMQPVKYQALANNLGVEIGSLVHFDKIRDAVLELRANKGMLAPDFEESALVGSVSKKATEGADTASPMPDLDRQSVGSFFTNPIIEREQITSDAVTLPEGTPIYEVRDEVIRGKERDDARGKQHPKKHKNTSAKVKLSAAYLIEKAGFPRGFQLPQHQAARLSTKHTLALVNTKQGYEKADAEVRELAQVIQNTVLEKFDIRLECEPIVL